MLVQYVLAFVAVIQMFLILALFKRVELHRKLHMRGAEAGVKLAMACMAMGADVIKLKKKVGIDGDQQQSTTDHKE
ncbi:hypothetical protein HWB52_gp44 [Pseudomonas phage Littlefix]|uniref:Uncharacterized protein n=1 Tax=Pseudomonas phage Littlefix TaxID=2079289 RepID=A0A2K9VHS6_9CAUD|nr:hypothetical protein HWB52_gp44 [Pseudomonas phage Littlefix]AUV61859.1 hypothetical protein PsPhLittlefix_gp44 [Pseudomonas phage Littlefix]